MKFKTNKQRHTKILKKNRKKTRKKYKLSENKNKSYYKSLDETVLYKLDYPYLEYYTKEIEVKNLVLELGRSFNPIILNKIPKHQFNVLPYQDKNGKETVVIFKENYNKNSKYYNITDYFSNRCRAICVFKNPKKKEQLSPYEYYQKNKTHIHNLLKQRYGKVSYYNLREHIYQNNKECSNFNNTIVISLLLLFKPKHWLDFSAGWGDRLIGAIAYGKCKYTGVDPSECMNANYHKIINTLVPEKLKHNYKIIQSGFETLSSKDIPDSIYDFIFTSPPFFDLEVYEKKEKQSINQYNSLQKWLDGFLYPTLRICYRALEVNGSLALYISDFYNVKYIDTMKDWILDNIYNFKYTGNIYWWNESNPTVIRTIFTWRKIK